MVRIGLPALRCAFAVAALAMLASCVKSPEHPLRVATHPWPGYESMHLAKSLGYFDATQVRLVEMANASQSYQALRNGTVDAAAQTLDEALGLIQDGVDLRVVLVMDVSDGADVVLARPEITSLQALRGKRVGVEMTSTGAVILDAMLDTAGMKATDIHLVALSMNEHAAAYTDGKVDALVTYDPPRSKLLQQGARVLFDSSMVPGRIVDVLVVRADVLADQQQSLTTLVAAHFKALDYLARHPQDAARRLAPYMGVHEDQVLPQFAGLILPDLAANRSQLSGTTASLPLRAAELSELMSRHHLLRSAVSVDHLVDPRFLPPDSK